MNHTEVNITEICRTEAAAAGLLFIGIRFRKQNATKVIELYVDSPASLTIDDCASLSRVLAERLEQLDMPDEPFLLNVSSPGIDRPLLYREQYPKHIGRVFALEIRWQGEHRHLRGKLLEVGDTTLVFELKNNEPLAIAFSDIISATVTTSFTV